MTTPTAARGMAAAPCTSIAPGHQLHFHQIRHTLRRWQQEGSRLTGGLLLADDSRIVAGTRDGVVVWGHHMPERLDGVTPGRCSVHDLGAGVIALAPVGDPEPWRRATLVSAATPGSRTPCAYRCAARGDLRTR